jgi:Concanavalin A-like lectin/glucanases superfamily
MTEWTFALTPLLVVSILLLFRFTGCESFGSEAAPPTPKYKDYLLGTVANPGEIPNFHHNVKPNGADVIAYWRLVDAPSDPAAKDERDFQHNGGYRESGKILMGQASLIANDPTVKGRLFDGGYVLVPMKSGLDPFYSENFTLEAWVLPGFAAGSEHVLFDAGGEYVHSIDTWTAFHGFRVYANAARCWQVRLLPGGDVFPSPPLIPPGGATHLAVTVQTVPGTPTMETVRIFIDGKSTAVNTVSLRSRPLGAPLLIGLGSDEKSTFDMEAPGRKPNASRPIQSRVQEVVLHKKALSQEEIENHFLLGKFNG